MRNIRNIKFFVPFLLALLFSPLVIAYGASIEITGNGNVVFDQGGSEVLGITTTPADAAGSMSGIPWANWDNTARILTLNPPSNVSGSFSGTLTFTHDDYTTASLAISVTITASYTAPTSVSPLSHTVNLANVPASGSGIHLNTVGGSGTGNVTFNQVGNWPTGVSLTPGGFLQVHNNAPHGTFTLNITLTRGTSTSSNIAFALELLPAANQILNLWVPPQGQSGFEVYRPGTGWVADAGHTTHIYFTAGETFGQVAHRIPQVRRQGYVFLNWRLVNSNGTQITNDHNLTDQLTLFAHFTPMDTISVTLNANGGGWTGVAAGNSRIIPLAHGQTLLSWQNLNTTVAPINPTRNGYEFVGWFVGNTRDEITLGVSTFTANTTLNARWRPIVAGVSGVANVTFSPNGGTWRTGGFANRTYAVRHGSSLSALGIASFEALDIVPVRSGFTFLGFRNVANQNTFLINTNIGFTNITVEAVWSSADSVNLIFNPNGGSWPNGAILSETRAIGRGQNIINYFGQTLNNFISTPTRAGFNFMGWYIGNTQFTSSTIVNNNTTVTARWEVFGSGGANQPAPPWASPGLTPGTVPSPAPGGQVNVPNPIGGFTDVLHGQWFFDYVTRVSQLGIFQGTSAGVFSPSLNMTRAMFVQALSNFHRADMSGVTQFGVPFGDVSVGTWYYAPVAWATNSEIVMGFGNLQNRTFATHANITREQIAVMLFNYANFARIVFPTNIWTLEFADQNNISDWASVAVSALHSAGVITGRPGNLFDPQAPATRAEVAAIFSRFEQFRN